MDDYEQINIQVDFSNCLSFIMPKQLVGRDDVRIIVEYVPDGEKKVSCTAWAQVNDGAIRGRIKKFVVAAYPDKEKQSTAILDYMNGNDEFTYILNEFVPLAVRGAVKSFGGNNGPIQ